MNTKKITKYTMLITFIAVVIFDIIMAVNNAQGDTISAVTRNAFMYTGGVVFGLGYLLSHLFWYAKKRRPFIISMFALIIGAAVFSLIQTQIIIMPIIYIIPGIIAGHFLWPQTKPKGL